MEQVTSQTENKVGKGTQFISETLCDFVLISERKFKNVGFVHIDDDASFFFVASAVENHCGSGPSSSAKH